MPAHAWLTLITLSGMLAALVTGRVGAHVAVPGALAVLVAAGAVPAGDVVAGLANEGLVTVACLYVLAAGLRASGVVGRVTARLLGRPTSDLDAQARIIGPVAMMSTVMNNTPLVAVCLPLLQEYARRHRIAPSRLLLPLSYAAILGGTCTLIGTSTNVVVNGLILAHDAAHPEAPIQPFGMFTLTPVGLPVTLAGVAYMLLAGRALLPVRPPGDDLGAASEGDALPPARAWVAPLMMGLFVVLSATGAVETRTAAIVAAAGVVLLGGVDLATARATIDWPVLAIIAAGLGLGAAMERSGLAAVAADVVLGGVAGAGPTALLAGIYALTWALTSVLSNSAAAVLVFPVAWRAAQAAGLPLEPVAIAVAIAASCEFTTPIGYQTNLMVLRPGGYRVIDYVRFGAPLTLVCGVVAVAVLRAWR